MTIINRMKKETKEVTRADKIWLNSIVKRQFMVVDDLIKFAKLYPDKIDREVVGSLFSIYEILRDTKDSVMYSHEEDEANRGNICRR